MQEEQQDQIHHPHGTDTGCQQLFLLRTERIKALPFRHPEENGQTQDDHV